MSNGTTASTDTPPYPGMVLQDGPQGYGWYKEKPKSLYEKATTGLVSPETIRKGTPYEFEKKQSEKAIAEGGQPWKAGIYAFGAGVDKSLSDFVSSLSSPASLALFAASGGESALGQGVLKTLLRGFGIGGAGLFGAKGAAEAASPKQPGESTADMLERRLMGASAAIGAAAGTGALGRDALHTVFRRSLKLDEDLAGTVADRVSKTQQARQKVETAKATTKGVMKSLEQQKMEAGGRLLADTQMALIQEHARVSKPFHEIAAVIKEPITSATSVREMIEGSVSDSGANPKEIPPAAFKALPEDTGAGTVSGVTSDIATLERINPKEVARLRAAGKLSGGDNVTFSDLTRIREDLGNAAQAAKDSAIKRGLFEAQEKVTALQEKAAQDKGLGPKYKAAKEQYAKFKRGIGSDLISNWLSAYDVEDQAIAPKVSKLFNKSTSQALRTVLSSTGLDVAPLDAIVESMKEVKEAGVTAKGEAKKEMRKAGSTQDIIPGTKASELAGMPNEDILRARLQSQANSMKEAGIREPFVLMQYVIGVFQLLRGSAFGSYHLARGSSMTLIPEKLKTPEFQDWVMDKAGIEDRVLTKKITDGLYKAVRKSMTSGVPEQATANESSQLP